MLGIDCHSDGVWQLLFASFKLCLFQGTLVTLPRIHDIIGVRMHKLVLWLNNTNGTLIVRRFLAIFLIVLSCLSRSLVRIGLCLLFLVHFFAILLHSIIDLFLKFCLLLIHVNVIEQWVTTLYPNSHKLWLTAVSLTVNVFHNLVISAQLFFVLSKDSIDTVYSCISYELLEICLDDKVCDIGMEHHIVSHADASSVVLIVLAFAHSVWKTPGSASLAVWASDFLALGLLNRLVPTNIEERLLVEELLFVVADHLFGGGLDAKASSWLDESCTRWHLTSLFHLAQVLIVLWPMLWI